MSDADEVVRKVAPHMLALHKIFLPGTLISLIVRAPGRPRPALVQTNETDLAALIQVLSTVATPAGETKQ